MMQGRLRPNSLELYRLYKIVAEDGTQSARITFQGSPTQQLNVGQDVIVSFPGVHGYAWNILTSGSSTFLTTCIFLPDEEADGYGVHVPIAESGDSKCHCYRLYNEQKEFGCMWFALWKLKTDVAIRNGCRLIVVTKKHGDVGYSQKGEIEYLKEKDVAFTSISIYQFAFHHLKSALDMVLKTDTFELRQVMHLLSPCQRQKLMDVLSEDGQDASLESARECPEPSDIGLQSATAQDIHAGVQSLPPELRQKLFQAIALLERQQMPQAPQPPGKQAQEKLILEENFRNTGQSRQLEKREKREKLDELEELENDERRAPTAPSSSTQHYATVRRKRPIKPHGPETQPECVIH